MGSNNCCNQPRQKEQMLLPKASKPPTQTKSALPVYSLLSHLRQMARESERKFKQSPEQEALFIKKKDGVSTYAIYESMVKNKLRRFSDPLFEIKQHNQIRVLDLYPGRQVLKPNFDPHNITIEDNTATLDLDSYVLACVFQGLALHNLQQSIQLTRLNINGYHVVKIYPDGAQTDVPFDDFILVNQLKEPIFLKSSVATWPILFQKGWQKLTGRFNLKKQYHPNQLWQEFTGCPTKQINITKDNKNQLKDIMRKQKTQCFLLARQNNQLGLAADQVVAIGRPHFYGQKYYYQLLKPVKNTLSRTTIAEIRLVQIFDSQHIYKDMAAICETQLLDNFKTFYQCQAKPRPKPQFISGKRIVNTFRLNNHQDQPLCLRLMQHFDAYVNYPGYEYSTFACIIINEQTHKEVPTIPKVIRGKTNNLFQQTYSHLSKGNYLIIITMQWPQNKPEELDFKLVVNAQKACDFVKFTDTEMEAVFNKSLLKFAKQNGKSMTHKGVEAMVGNIKNFVYVALINKSGRKCNTILELKGCVNILFKGKQQRDWQEEVVLEMGEQKLMAFRQADLLRQSKLQDILISSN